METAAARPQLPALAFPDTKLKRDEDTYQSRATGLPSGAVSRSASLDSAYHHPPPPYSHGPPFPQANLAAKISSEQMTPPGSRRASGEKDIGVASVQSKKQSLPSISEALGVDNQMAYQTTLPAQSTAAAPPPPPPMPPMQTSLHKTAVPTSPIPAMRSYAAEPSRPYAPSNASKYPASEAPQPVYPDVRPALHVSTAQPSSVYPQGAVQGAYPHPGTASPGYDSQQHLPPGFTYGYAPYPPRYLQGNGSVPAASIYQPSSITPAPVWKSTNLARSDERAYGESVKRHLDMYDFESALNDISSASSFLGDFAHRYGNLLHSSPRTNPPLSMLPGMVEIEDMIAKSRAQTEAIQKIRETVLAQQVAHDQEAAEQRSHQKRSSFDMAPPHSGDSDDGKSNFASDNKKQRRGRAAPPGRCHSCNRAETPEWRRGPDGARTLCNACGLHYAKLTRKQNTAGNKIAVANSSNLRPKEHAP